MDNRTRKKKIQTPDGKDSTFIMRTFRPSSQAVVGTALNLNDKDEKIILSLETDVNTEKIKSTASRSYQIDYAQFNKCIAIANEIQTGGYGTVFHVKWNDEDVAAKRIDCDGGMLAACERERSILEKLTEQDAPNIIKLKAYCINNRMSTYYILMEYMPMDLVDFMEKNPLGVEWKVRYLIMSGITQGVAYLHSLNIIHRDIKLENVLVGDNNEIKLCDFGAAKYVDKSFEFIGTKPYIPPEVLEGKPHTKKSDIYSLGITFFELSTTWYRMYENKTEDEILEKIKKGKRQAIPKDCPQEMATLIRKCWSQEPKKRPEAEKILPRLHDCNRSAPS